MEENIQISLRLLLIGMTSVSLILLLVVLSSKLLINIVNRTTTKGKKHRKGKNIDPKIIAAINASVEIYTGGKARIDSIKKI